MNMMRRICKPCTTEQLEEAWDLGREMRRTMSFEEARSISPYDLAYEVMRQKGLRVPDPRQWAETFARAFTLI